MRLVLILSVVVVIAVLAAGSVAATLIIRDTGRPSEATAQYIPADVDFYLYLDLDNIRGDLASQFLTPFKSEAFKSVRDDFLGEIQKEIGLLEGVTSLIGTDVTVALFAGEDKSVEPDWTVLAQTKGRDEGETFAERVREILSEDHGVTFTQDAYLGADLFVVDAQDPALGVTDEYVIYCVNPARLKGIIDNLATPPANSLQGDEAFRKATASLPFDRSAFVFLRNDSPSRGEVFELATLGTVPLGQSDPEFAAASASFIERGVRLDLYMDPIADGLIPTAENGLLSADRLPEDALMLLSFVGANEAWQQFLESGGADDLFVQTNRKDELDGLVAVMGLSALDSAMGTLQGEVALALLPSDIRIDSNGDLESGVINALLMAETVDASGFEALLDIAMGLFAPGLSMMGSAGAQSFQPTQIDIGEYQAKFWDLSGLLGATFNYEPGYLVTEDMLVIGSTTDSLQKFNGALTGDTSSLRSNKTFSKALELAPSPLQFLMYADIAGIVEMVENSMAPETLVEYTQQVKAIVTPFESLIMAGSSTEEGVRFTLAITIKE